MTSSWKVKEPEIIQNFTWKGRIKAKLLDFSVIELNVVKLQGNLIKFILKIKVVLCMIRNNGVGQFKFSITYKSSVQLKKKKKTLLPHKKRNK